MNLLQNTPLLLEADYTNALKQMEHSTDHLFITGRAGTGKSTLLQLFKRTSKKKLVVLAPTGIAALNVGGQTIHSFFGFPPRIIDKSEISRRKNYRIYGLLDAIVIDEISMVRADMLDNIDLFLRINRKNNTPFGGVQMIFFGDLYQLPPVVSSSFERKYFQEYYQSPYFFSAKVFDQGFTLSMYELTKIYRQNEQHFIKLLESVRQNTINEDHLMDLNERHLPIPFDMENLSIQVCAKNIQADIVNQRELENLTTKDYVYKARVNGNFGPNIFPTELMLKLKVGAQIMFIKNDLNKEYVNGTLGKVIFLNDDHVSVEIFDKNNTVKHISVKPDIWENIKYSFDEESGTISNEIIGSFEQYPLKLAWAITIHKSQGKTFDNVIIDLGSGAFESGQTYVALSRCRSLNGIYLKSPITYRDIILDERIVEYYDLMRRY